MVSSAAGRGWPELFYDDAFTVSLMQITRRYDVKLS
jgi:hypothetical protein